MPSSPNHAKPNNKNTIIKNNKTPIQGTRLRKPTNSAGLSLPPPQTNSNSSNNDSWTQQAGKRNHSSSSEPNTPTNIQTINKNKKYLYQEIGLKCYRKSNKL